MIVVFTNCGDKLTISFGIFQLHFIHRWCVPVFLWSNFSANIDSIQHREHTRFIEINTTIVILFTTNVNSTSINRLAITVIYNTFCCAFTANDVSACCFMMIIFIIWSIYKSWWNRSFWWSNDWKWRACFFTSFFIFTFLSNVSIVAALSRRFAMYTITYSELACSYDWDVFHSWQIELYIILKL